MLLHPYLTTLPITAVAFPTLGLWGCKYMTHGQLTVLELLFTTNEPKQSWTAVMSCGIIHYGQRALGATSNYRLAPQCHCLTGQALSSPEILQMQTVLIHSLSSNARKNSINWQKLSCPAFGYVTQAQLSQQALSGWSLLNQKSTVKIAYISKDDSEFTHD